MGAIKSINLPTALYAIFMIWAVVGFLPILPAELIYTISIVYSIFCLKFAKKLDVFILFFLLYIPLGLLVAQPNSVFKSWYRYGLFLILFINVSSLLQSKYLRTSRRNLFTLILSACAVLGVGSFCAKLLGVNFMTIPPELESLNDPDDTVNTTGLFSGLTNHSMILGPVAGIGACYLSSLAIKLKNKWYWILAILSIGAVLFSASRSAAAATFVGVMVALYKQSGTNSKFLRLIVIIFILLASTFSLWQGALSGIIEKNGGTSVNVDSRLGKWVTSIESFNENPIFGVGFCASSNLYDVDMSTGRIESGSSWLNVLSMLGIIGVFFIFYILFRAMLMAFRTDDEIGPVLCGVLLLFFVHMFAEGYIFAGGSFLALMLWLTVGVATDCKYKSLS